MPLPVYLQNLLQEEYGEPLNRRLIGSQHYKIQGPSFTDEEIRMMEDFLITYRPNKHLLQYVSINRSNK